MLKSSFINVLIKIIALIGMFIFQSYLAKLISVDDYAIFSKFIVYGNYAALFLSFGFSSSIIYFSENKRDFFLNYNSISFFYLFVTSLLIFLLWIFSSDLIFVVYFAVVFNMFNVTIAYYQSQLKMIWFGALGAGNSLYLLTLLLFIERFDFVKDNLLIFYGFYFLFIIVIFQFISLSFSIGKVGFKALLSRLGTNIRYGSNFVPVLILGQFIYVLDFILIDFLLGENQVAYYFVSMMVSKLLFSAADTIGTVIYPYLIKYSNGKGKEHVLNTISTLGLIFFAFNIFALVGFYIVGEQVIQYFFGEEYLSAYEPALILLCGTQGMIIYKLLSRKLASENKWRGIYLSLITAVFINLALSFYLISNLGINGAALASSVAYWVCGFMILFYNRLTEK